MRQFILIDQSIIGDVPTEEEGLIDNLLRMLIKNLQIEDDV